ncbi:MAG: flagellar biosynthesis protein FlhA [Myxococcota bacterium]
MAGDATGAVLMVGIVALAVLPLPPFMLDILLSASLCLSLLVFLVALYVERPLEFSSFPSLLVLVTLFRLSLNVASTRNILLHGGDGVDAAGQVIAAFGDFAVGGNYVVGAVVFLILVLVNFIVITKGADRISEVGARFTLDSMPGKQMAIDSDLVAGLIDERTARKRREDVQASADFHGAMDGASKFVRGDAIAGLVIVAINVVAGIIIGITQHDLSLVQSAETYSILSIGDGLVSQLPGLLVSTGAALLVTRDSNGTGGLMGSVAGQLLSRPRAAAAAAGVLGVIGIVPGMPHLPLLGLAAATGFIAYRASTDKRPSKAKGSGLDRARLKADADRKKLLDPEAQKNEIESLLPVELLSMELGLQLLPLVDVDRGGGLLARIASVRKQRAQELGFIVPPVCIRDELTARPGAYRILISGVKVAEGEIKVGKLLAIDPTGRATQNLPGELVREPTFGLPAKWIAPGQRGTAEAAGCTVVDPSAVVATHLTEVVRRQAHELLGRREAQELVDIAAKTNSKVVEELVPHLMPLGDVIKVMRSLLQEGVSLRDVRTILETLADAAAATKDVAELTEAVRQRLSRRITQAQVGHDGRLRAMVLDPKAEDLLRKGGRGTDGQTLTRLTNTLAQAAQSAVEQDQPALLVVAPDVRRAAAAIAGRHVQGLSVMSYREVDPSVPLMATRVIGPDGVRVEEARA